MSSPRGKSAASVANAALSPHLAAAKPNTPPKTEIEAINIFLNSVHLRVGLAQANPAFQTGNTLNVMNRTIDE